MGFADEAFATDYYYPKHFMDLLLEQFQEKKGKMRTETKLIIVIFLIPGITRGKVGVWSPPSPKFG